jgi:hypothetical protein
MEGYFCFINRRVSMKRILAFILGLSITITLTGFSENNIKAHSRNLFEQKTIMVKTIKAEDEIRKLVTGFGSKLQKVSLLAPKELQVKSMNANYKAYVAAQLLAKWTKAPASAPGRYGSSPWPDRIEVKSIKKLSTNEYRVKGSIVEITSVELVNKGVFDRRAISLTVVKQNNRWLISSASIGSPKLESNISLNSFTYGFRFTLPSSWKGFRLIKSKWEALPTDNPSSTKNRITGPMLTIRHPQWTETVPRQDIPIMVFTIKQWNLIAQDKYHVGAAPVGPQQIGRNTKYVFALPARYNFAFPEGYEEVDNIISHNPIRTDFK